MRIRVDVAAVGADVAWRDVHGPARALLYGLIRENDPELAQELHDSGWQGSTLRPLGISPPMFVGAAPRHGAYTTSGQGSFWLGTPVPVIAAVLLKGLAGRKELRWGGLGLQVRGVELEGPPDHRSGWSEFTTVSPVLVKKDGRFLMPGDDGYLDRLTHNLRHKADVLGLPNEIGVDVIEAGPRRGFEVSGAMRIGATVRARVESCPALLDALYDWGLGLATVQGFGWVR
jgi:CRISPR-associated endoribonuclease Cas6